MRKPSQVSRFVIAIVALVAVSPASGQEFEVLHDFDNPPVRPVYGLTIGPGGVLYGVASGGKFGAGSVFAFTPPSGLDAGAMSVFGSLPNFSMWPANPELGMPVTPLTLASDGNLYGARERWNNETFGGIYRISATGDYEPVHAFTLADGNRPNGPFVEVDGWLYGTLYYAGYSNTFGAVYRLDPASGQLQVIHTFSGGSGGANPEGGLVVRPGDGMLYGTTRSGGAQNRGTIFRISPAGASFEVLHHFPNTSPWLAPTGELTVGPDGMLYGAATYSDYPGGGCVFRFDPDARVLTPLHAFTRSDDKGLNPSGGMVVTASAVYGVAPSGSYAGTGTVFRIGLAPGSALEVLRSFNYNDRYGSRLVQGPDGFIYGFAAGGFQGPAAGEIFRIDPASGAVTTVHRFGVATDGRAPFAIVETGPGVLHGTTREGGVNNRGTVFRRGFSGELATTLSFADGALTKTSRTFLTPASDGLLYGTRSDGGAPGYGSLFSLDPADGDYQLLYAAPSAFGVSVPHGPLLESTQRAATFYGTAISQFYEGTTFETTPSGSVSALWQPGALGVGLLLSEPVGTLVETSDGAIYGAFREWWYSSYVYIAGGVFRVVPGAAPTVVKRFYYSEGSDPEAGLTLGPPAADGTPVLYGTTARGGIRGLGSVFAITTTGTYSRVHSFDGQDGEGPVAELTLAADGRLYGTTREGGAHDLGVLYAISPGGVYEKLRDFDWVTGAIPETMLIAGSDGNLYGVTPAGGSSGGGVLFRYNLAPTATIGGPYEVLEGGSVTLTAGGSDPQGAPLTFDWDLDGDGEYDDGSGASVSFVATTPDRDGDGTYDVAVRASDATGIPALAETTVTVRNVAPEVSAGGDASLELGGTLARAGSFADPGPDSWTATVDYGDGSGSMPLALAGTSFTLEHAYPESGAFTVVVTVADDDGGIGSATFRVEVGTVEDQLEDLIGDVEDLLDDGTLKLGQGKSLIGKLELALYMLKWGNTKKAVTMLEAFIQEVEAFLRAGILTPEQGDPLIAKARAAIASLR